MTQYFEVITGHTTCEQVLGKKCNYDMGKNECDGCVDAYDSESQEVIDELMNIGYEVQDIHESGYVGSCKTWWVMVTGARNKKSFGLEWA